MENVKRIVFAPHDDGGGAFGALCRLARALLLYADDHGCTLDVYFLNSSQAEGGQARLADLLRGTARPHTAVYVPTDNLIWLPKDEEHACVIGGRIPGILRKSIGPLWHCWPSAPNWIRPNLPVAERKDWADGGSQTDSGVSGTRWKSISAGWGDLRDLTPQWWRDVALGISMGVPQLHRVARREGFPSVEVGDWFFSIGLEGCMTTSSVPPGRIAEVKRWLRMIAEDEFKAREFWGTLLQSPHDEYIDHLKDSPVRFREMTGLLWTGDPLPADVTSWPLADELREKLKADIRDARKAAAGRIACVVPGRTNVWQGIIGNLKKRPMQKTKGAVAIIELTRQGQITLLEDGGIVLRGASDLLGDVPVEVRQLATSRASDVGIVRTAGGVLSFASTQRPSVFVNEPGHWLGDIHRRQCRDAGLCVVASIDDMKNDAAREIQKKADDLDNGASDVAKIAGKAAELPIGAERELAEYLFTTYVV